MKPKSNELNLKLGRNPCFKISKNLFPNLRKTMEIRYSVKIGSIHKENGSL